MATITPAPGKGSIVKCNGTVLKLTSWERTRTPGKLPYATTGMSADADGNYETPHAAGLVETSIRIEGPYDTALPFFGEPYNIRAGTSQLFQFGQVSGGAMTPSAYYRIGPTTDGTAAADLGKWSAELWPATDTAIAYLTSV